MEMVNGDFIATLMPVVHRFAEEYELSIEDIAGGQACLESNFGLSELATKANNLFGRKHREGFDVYYKVTKERIPVPDDYIIPEDKFQIAYDPWYTHPYSIELQLTVYKPIEDHKDWYTVELPFNKYDTWEDGVEDYFFCIKTFDAYKEAREALPDKKACLKAIGHKYATDDTYADKIQYMIDRYNLNAYN
jgi:flagellum-specific peptidoglycan hydrolase FlgJ